MLLRGKIVKAVTFDVQGTLIHHRAPVEDVYSSYARRILPNPPTSADFKAAFPAAYAATSKQYPSYRYPGKDALWSSRRWWRELCRTVLESTNREYSEYEVDRFFRAVYQHYGSPAGYAVYPDAREFMDKLSGVKGLCLGVTANCSTRTIDTTLPVLSLSQQMQFFTCSQEVGNDKPSLQMFAATLKAIQHWVPGIEKNQVLHIGSNQEVDYVAARQFGFQSILLDRSGKAKDRDQDQDQDQDLHLDYHLAANTVKTFGQLETLCSWGTDGG